MATERSPPALSESGSASAEVLAVPELLGLIFRFSDYAMGIPRVCQTWYSVFWAQFQVHEYHCALLESLPPEQRTRKAKKLVVRLAKLKRDVNTLFLSEEIKKRFYGTRYRLHPSITALTYSPHRFVTARIDGCTWLYVVDAENDMIQAHKGGSVEPEFSFRTGQNPKGIALSKNNTIWVSHQFPPGYREEGDLREYDLKGRLLRETNMPLSTVNVQKFLSYIMQPRGLAIDRSTNNMYTAIWSHRHIRELDGNGGLIKTINEVLDKDIMVGPSEIAMMPPNLLVSDTCDCSVKSISIETGKVVATLLRSKGWMSHSVGVGVDPLSNILFITPLGVLHVFDYAYQPILSFPVLNELREGSHFLAVDNDDGSVFISSPDNNSIWTL
eukprot:TRINITY_DN6039_c0_g1_i2.p1 TRINITY_DN6039_c0_g1~~TRINITY_DN6039_c0_g1_i2.p1  ORF type:complete len:385 (-),score=40.93 TRINITY_DN6039_c0_g1_i2:4-1158(-)